MLDALAVTMAMNVGGHAIACGKLPYCLCVLLISVIV